MKDKKIRLVIWLVAITLVGLIGVQLYLVSNALELRKKELNRNLLERLERISKIMEDDMFCFEAFARLQIMPNQGFYMLKNKMDKKGYFVPSGDKAADSVKMYMYYMEGNNRELYDFSSIKVSHPMDADIIMKFEYSGDMGSHKYMDKREPIKQLTAKNFKDELSMKRPMREYLNTKLLDSLLKDAVKASGLTGKFYYGVIDNDKKIQYASKGARPEWLLNSELQTGFLNTKYFNNPYKLVLYVPVDSIKLLRTVWVVLLSSLVIVLLLAFSFRYFVNAINRQKKLSRMKSDFIDNMTHEFKTPLTNISLALQNIEEHGEEDGNKLHRYLDIISEENERLRANVERVLHIASTDKLEFELKKEMVDINELIERIASTFRTQNHLNGTQIVTNPGAKPSLIMADEVHVTNVLFNLIDNAIKYSPGNTKIDVGTRNTSNGILISVKDEGIGMSDETQKRIFDKFFRAGNGNIHDVKGFGLGLSYVKAIVDAHRGTIRVKSEMGKGSLFEIELVN